MELGVLHCNWIGRTLKKKDPASGRKKNRFGETGFNTKISASKGVP